MTLRAASSARDLGQKSSLGPVPIGAVAWPSMNCHVGQADAPMRPRPSELRQVIDLSDVPLPGSAPAPVEAAPKHGGTAFRLSQSNAVPA